MGLAARRSGAGAMAGPAAAVPVSAALGVTVVGMGEPAARVGVTAVVVGVVVVALAVLSVAGRRTGGAGPADAVTLVRAVLVGACASWALLSVTGDLPARSWWLVWLALPALLLDAVDGVVARRTGTASPAGARLDMETDAALLLVLAVAAAQVVGPWVLLIGGMRYLWVLAGALRPPLRAPLPDSRARRVVAGVQGGVLVGVVTPVVPTWLAFAASALALALLLASFGRDGLALERAGRVLPFPRSRPVSLGGAPRERRHRRSDPARPAR